MDHLPQQDPMPPVVGIIDRQDPAEEVVDEVPELLGRAAEMGLFRVLRPAPASMGVEHHLNVELFLIAEMVIDRRNVRPGTLANRPDPRRIESFLRKLLARRL